MKRPMVGLLALGAVLVAVVMATLARERRGTGESVAHALPAAEENAELEPSMTLAGSRLETSDRSDAEAPARSQREVAPSTIADELARAQWVEGRVVFPADTPTDEEVFVVASGREFSDGRVQRARVERDGRFRVPFTEESENGWLALEAHYLYLEKKAFWERRRGEVVLEPMLGGRVMGQVLAPAGVGPRAARGEVKLVRGRSQNVDSFSSPRARQDVGADLAFDLGGVPADSVYRVVYEGAELVGSAAETKVEVGGTTQVQIELELGAVVSGRVVDESGVGVGDIKVVARMDPQPDAARRIRSDESDPDGEFRISALPGGDTMLVARTGDYQDVRFDVGRLATGDVREGIELVLRRGNSISGRVQWPERAPAEAHIEAFAEAPGSESAWISHSAPFPAKRATSSANGTFRITGLDAGPYTIRAKGKRTEEVTVWSEVLGRERTHKKGAWLEASAEHVAVGTANLRLLLSAGHELQGRVVDDLGAPVRSCRVTATPLPRRSPRQIDGRDPLRRKVESKDGSFRLDGLSPGEWELTASGEGYDDSEPVRLSIPSESPVVITLLRDARVRQKP